MEPIWEGEWIKEIYFLSSPWIRTTLNFYVSLLLFCLLFECSNDGLRDLENRLHPEDKEIFFMDTKDICWNDYMLHYVLGIRKYCLKDDPSTLPRARRVFTYLYIADRILRLIFLAALAWFLYHWIAPYFQLKTV